MAFREAVIQALLCDFVRLQYPNAYFVSDSSGEHRATIQQRARAARLRKSRGYPDFFMPEPRGVYHGLFLELKAENSKLEKLSGDFITPHVGEQYQCLSDLRQRGFYCCFAIGLDQAIEIVQNYMQLRSGEELGLGYPTSKELERAF